ncbi:MAG: NUDIX domain-containing protein [Anaerolineales bacterium]|nr:NUDIX domain-containing protein [Anaerolineales bacterium]
MDSILEKVTCLITRRMRGGIEILLIQHSTSGIQIPAGTAELGETPDAAALREASKESGLSDLRIVRLIGYQDTALSTKIGL